MWCDLPKEERVKDFDCPCVIWHNGKFLVCSHWHEGRRDKSLSESANELDRHCSYKDIME